MTPPTLRWRDTFGAKLTLALLGTVGLLLGATLLAVRIETGRQIREVTETTLRDFETVFTRLLEDRQATLSQLLNPLTTVRAAAALEGALESGPESLAEAFDYELERAQVADIALQIYTDADGYPVLTRLDGRTLEGEDPAGIEPMIDRFFEEALYELTSFLTIEDRLFQVSLRAMEIGPNYIGAIAFGTEVEDDFARDVSALVGGHGEVCMGVEGRCLAATPGVRGGGSTLFGDLMGTTGSIPVLTAEDGGRWSVTVAPLDEASPDDGWRVAAIPIDPVLAPLDRIASVLAVAGALALAFAGLVSIRLARSLARPVGQLTTAAGKVATGDLDVSVAVDADDELGRLAGAFNDMTEGLRLKEQYRGVLDKVVSKEVAEELLQGDVELGGESRHITVLFADIRGFTALTDGMDPEHVITLINECMSRLSDAVDRAGGIVDKYVGDELMAVFGAPISHGDDAERAVRAALWMQQSIGEWNDDRTSRGERAVGLGIGINTGNAVAGNMGSADRLNYTVLGDTVNLAARLCSAAPAGEIWVSDHTLEEAGNFSHESVGEQSFKGFSAERSVYRVTSMLGTVLAAGALLLGTTPSVASAQDEGDWPTLLGLGLGYISESGAVQFDLSGRLDVEHYLPSDEPTLLIAETDAFWAGRVRLFGDLFLGDRIFSTVELRVDRGEEPNAQDLEFRVEQAFVRIQPTNWEGFQLQAGKMTGLFGEYGQRHRTEQDPFIRAPLMHEYRTVVPSLSDPADMADFLTYKDRPEKRPDGAPIVWAVPYQWTVAAVGGFGPLSYRVGVTNSAPGSAPEAWEWNSEAAELGQSPVAALAWQVDPSLRVSASWTKGPYLSPQAVLDAPVMGIGDEGAFRAYDQGIWGAEIMYTRGPLVLRAEGVLDSWDVPGLDQLIKDQAAYIEAQVDVSPGLWVAARHNRIFFGEMEDNGMLPAGTDRKWDYDVDRLQLATGYRLARNAEIRTEFDWTVSHTPGENTTATLWSVQWWWAF